MGQLFYLNASQPFAPAHSAPKEGLWEKEPVADPTARRR